MKDDFNGTANNGGVSDQRQILGQQLLQAVEDGHLKRIISLIEQGAYLDEKDSSGNTPLMIAIRQGEKEKDQEIVRTLIKYMNDGGYSFNDANERGENAAVIAVKNKRALFLDILVRDTNINLDDPDNNGNTPLILAAGWGLGGMVSSLIKADVFVNAQNAMGESALIEAARKGYVHIVKDLLNEGNANPDLQDRYDSTALLLAIEHGFTQTAKVLIGNHAKLDKRDSSGNHAVHWACYSGDLEILQILIRENMWLDDKNYYGFTPMILACKWRHPEIVRELLAAGADWTPVSREGHDALWFAENNYNRKAAKMIKAAIKAAAEAESNRNNNSGNNPRKAA